MTTLISTLTAPEVAKRRRSHTRRWQQEHHRGRKWREWKKRLRQCCDKAVKDRFCIGNADPKCPPLGSVETPYKVRENDGNNREVELDGVQ